MNQTAKNWIKLTRPQTLPAALGGALVGCASVFQNPNFSFFWSFVALAFALSMQVLANIVNDLADSQNGVDTTERIGPKRQAASNTISSEAIKKSAILLSIAGSLIALISMQRLGLAAALLGSVCVVFAWIYSSGKVAASHRYGGELLAYVFFGIILVGGSSWLAVGTLNWPGILFGICIGWWPVGIMAINNLRDLNTDFDAGKKTVAHLIGKKGMQTLIVSSWLFAIIGSYAALLSLRNDLNLAWLTLIPILGIFQLWTFLQRGDRHLNKALAFTGMSMGIHCLLLTLQLL